MIKHIDNALTRRLRPMLFVASFGAMFTTQAASAQSATPDQPIGILLAAGDIAECKKDLDDTEKKNWFARTGAATAELIRTHIDRAKVDGTPIYVLAVGDLAYQKGEKRTFFNCFDKTWGTFKDKILPVPGNHDVKTKHGKYYRDYFADVLKEVKADPKLSYYAINFPPPPSPAAGAWRLIALNSERFDKTQLKWLDQTLEQTEAPCVLVFSHGFIYGSGRYGHGPKTNGKYDVGEPLMPFKQMKKAFSLLYKHHVSLLVSGHDHHFEQLGKTNDKADHEDKGASAMVDDGVRSFIVGTGGAYLYPNFKKANVWAFTEAYSFKNYGVLKIELFPGWYRWRFLEARPKENASFPDDDKQSDFEIKSKVQEERCNIARSGGLR